MEMHHNLRNDVASAQSECAHIEFKDRFDPSAKGDWCGLIKDLLAIANSGGGCIVFGLKSDGSYAGIEPCGFASIDAADVTNKVSSFLYRQFAGFELTTFEREGRHHPTIIVAGVSVPLVPRHDGNFTPPGGKTTSAFSQGVAYFRHGAKSEPAEQEDFDRFCRRTEERARIKFAEEMQNVARLPEGYTVQAVPPNAVVAGATVADQFRLTDDPNAPGCIVVDKFKTHKHPRKAALAGLLTRLPGLPLTVFDIQCIRRVHGDELRRLDLIYEPKDMGPRYSDSFIEWTVDRAVKNSKFFSETRSEYDKLRHA